MCCAPHWNIYTNIYYDFCKIYVLQDNEIMKSCYFSDIKMAVGTYFSKQNEIGNIKINACFLWYLYNNFPLF